MRPNKRLIAAPVAAAVLYSSTAVLAADDSGSIIEEIIVTATKREQSLIDIPMSVSALGEKSLERIGADNFEGFVGQVPGLTHNSNGGNSAKFAIRGISTSTGQSNTQSPVAVYNDELPVLDTFAPLVTPDLRLFDVNRVEVLRGPQGTLFGSGALGGAIRVITNKPNMHEFEAKLGTTIATVDGGEQSYAFNAMANLPLIDDKLALRAVAYSRNGGGYVDNEVRGESDVDSQSSLGGRLMLKWAPSDDLSVLFTVVSQDDEPDDRAFSRIDGQEDEYDAFIEEPVALSFTTENLVVEYDLGSVSLTSSSTFSSRNEDVQNDASGLLQPVVAGLGVNSGVADRIRSNTDTFAQEVRLTSTAESSFEWLIGAFYLNSDRRYIEAVTSEGLDGALTAIGMPTAGRLYPADTLFGVLTEIETTETAVFGEVTYAFNEAVSATVGARWFSNEQKLEAVTDGLLGAGRPQTDRDTKETAITPKFSVSYRPNPDVHYYASATKGYRIGQSNFALPVLPGIPESPQDYDADSLWNYEVGLKTSFLKGSLDVQAAVFYIDWQDIQLQERNAVGFNFINNAGEATSKGIELSLDFNANENLSLGSAISYNDTELTSVNAGVNASRGDELPGSAKFKVANHVQWVQSLSADVVGHVRFDHQYSSNAFTQLNNQTSPKTEDYNLFSLHVGADFGGWELDLFAKNLSNNRRITNVIGGLNGNTAIRLRPREVGVSVRASF